MFGECNSNQDKANIRKYSVCGNNLVNISFKYKQQDGRTSHKNILYCSLID